MVLAVRALDVDPQAHRHIDQTVLLREQVLYLLDQQSAIALHGATLSPVRETSDQSQELAIGFEPMTCCLQGSRSTT